MFNLSTQDVVLSIKNTPLVNLDGLIYQKYDNFFGNSFELPFDNKENFIKLEYTENKNRSKIDDSDVDIKKLKAFFMNSKITKTLGQKFGTDLKFESLDVWSDGKGYSLVPHVDHPTIKLHLQIYLSNNSVGTSLYRKNKKDKILTFTFEKNKGYGLLNNEHSVHGVDLVTEDGRISIYARYS